MLVINSVKLSFKILNFRAYSTTVPSGGGSTTTSGGGSTSGSGGGQTSSSTATPSGGGSTSGTYSIGSHNHSLSVPTTINAYFITYSGGNLYCSGGGTVYLHGGQHTLTLQDGTSGSTVYMLNRSQLAVSGGGSLTTSSSTHDSLPSHSHTITINNATGTTNERLTFNNPVLATYNSPIGELVSGVYVESHTHTTPDHTHPTHTHTVDNHTHTTPNHAHDTPAHAHSLTFGIYEESNSPSINVYIDNGAGYGASIGTYTTDQQDLDITVNISGTGWKRVKFTSTARCRIAAIIECKLDITA